MAFSSLFTLLDDIASLLDDVSVMTKVAAKKTVGVVGDDLALNANQVTGATAERELPIVWSVAKGSLVNKVILIPIALLLAAFLPALIVPLLMLGGAYLCFEGVEKILHKFFAHEHHHEKNAFDEKAKIRGAVLRRTRRITNFRANHRPFTHRNWNHCFRLRHCGAYRQSR